MTQQEAFDILKLGYNVYFTGPAGSGKSWKNRYVQKSSKIFSSRTGEKLGSIRKLMV